jgi:hypothetical protein
MWFGPCGLRIRRRLLNQLQSLAHRGSCGSFVTASNLDGWERDLDAILGERLS